ncbi:MAG TPA: immune inhibitor A [Bacteroidia bacterium]|nr:immune inhibitor A [Bacteroidia bacterium]HNT80556.1 immune inhibitor A [Bacteroidia bacterium]
MKRVLLFIALVFAFTTATQAQNCVISEDFEIPDSVGTSGFPGWNVNPFYQVSGTSSVFATVDVDTQDLFTFPFSTVGNTFVLLEFWHIAKIEFFDRAIIEYSTDGGISWTKIDTTNSTYLTPMPNASGTWDAFGSFMSPSYGAWDPANPTNVTNAMWQKETFDLSGILANQPNAAIRFRLYDSNGNGNFGYYGWLLEDLCVLAAPCELTPPTLTQLAPFLNGAVYNLGPYTINLEATDASGIDTVTMTYTINGGAPITIGMSTAGGNIYTAQIPMVNDSDVVCYSFFAQDAASGCNNSAILPSNGSSICFQANAGITFPFCDNFDIDTLWTAVNVSGSSWELGLPTQAPTNTVHSAPSCWDVQLAGQYQNSTETYLYLNVPLDFTQQQAFNAEISIWVNYSTENIWDGARIDWSTDSVNWNVLGGVGQGTNWYNAASLNSSGLPGWTNNSNGWIQASVVDPALNGQTGVIFRYVFTSDASVQGNGFSIDDFCITPPQPEDAGVTRISAPVDQPAAGTSSPVTVTVKNFGYLPLTAFDIVYDDGSGPQITPWTGNLQPGDTMVVNLLPNYTVPTGAVNFCAYTSLATDGFHPNDTMCKTIVGIPTLTVTYCDDFESGNIGWYSKPSTTGNTQWQLGTPAFGATNSANSGSNAWDINLTSAYDVNSNAELVSPIFDFSNPSTFNSTMEFWMNRNIPDIGDGLKLEYTINGTTWQTLGIINDPNATNWFNQANVGPTPVSPAWSGSSAGWKKSSYFLALINGEPFVRFRFRFNSNGFTNGDGVSIDDFCIKTPQPDDAGITAIVTPNLQTGAQQPFNPTVTLKNFGTNTLTSVPITYTVNGLSPKTFNWTGSLAFNASTNVLLPDTSVAPDCLFSIEAYTELVGDGDLTNDTSRTTVTGVPIVMLNTPGAVCDNFDIATPCWISIPSPQNNSVWQIGTPAFGLTNSAFSAPNAWDINLNTGYEANAEAYLYTPKYDMSLASNAKLSLQRNHNTEQNWDGVRIDYSINGGATWVRLGNFNDPNGVNWYNLANLNSSGQPGWAGNSNGWQYSEFNINLLSGEPDVQFRFAFTSDASVHLDGFSIDDFCLKIPFPDDIGVQRIVVPGPFAPGGDTINPVARVRNYGSNTQTTYDVCYSLNGAAPLCTTWTAILAPNDTVDVPLPQMVVPAGVFNLCAWTQLIGDGDLTNDTSCAATEGIPTILISYANQYCADFDSLGSSGWVADPAAGPTVWELGTPNAGLTNSAHSAPNSWDLNLNGPYTLSTICHLYSPFFKFTSVVDANLSFWQNRNLQNNSDGVTLEYSINGNPWTPLGVLGQPKSVNWYTLANLFPGNKPVWSGPSGGWIQSSMDSVFIFNNALTVQFRYEFTSDAFTVSDGMSIDDFCLEVPIPLNATPTVVSTTNPTPLNFPGPITFRGLVKNGGTTPIDEVDVTLQINGASIVTDHINFPTPLNKNTSYWHTFSIPWQAFPGAHDVCVITSNPNMSVDLNPFDDTTCAVITVFDSVTVAPGFGFCNDFESGPQWVTTNSVTYQAGNSWQAGTPGQSVINNAFSGTNAWMTGLTTNYPNRDSSALYTPVFNIDYGKCYKLSFMHNYYSELYQDGGTVEYTTDNAQTWTVMGFGLEPNWMNSLHVTALGGIPPRAGWSGNSNGWLSADHLYQPWVTGQVIFRFRFASDNSFGLEGWAIDDVCFEEVTTPCVTSVIDPEADGLLLGQNYPNPSNGYTTIEYSIPTNGHVSLEIIDLLGQTIMTPLNENQSGGVHSIDLNTNRLSPGIYFYVLRFNKDNSIMRKMVITE